MSIIEDGPKRPELSIYKNVVAHSNLAFPSTKHAIPSRNSYALKSKPNVIKIMFFRYKYITIVGNPLSPTAKNCSDPQLPVR